MSWISRGAVVVGILTSSFVLAGCETRKEPLVGASDATPEFVPRPNDGGSLTGFVRQELSRAEADGRHVLVYVGATWCEPCRRFHHAVESGKLDRELAGIRFLELDLDEDGPDLGAAGYSSRLIPLMVVPNADGTGSDRRIQGSVKGPGAVREDLLPKMRRLLAQTE